MTRWRFVYTRLGGGPTPARGVVTVRPSGDVLDGEVYTPDRDGPADRPTTAYVHSGAILDREFASFLAARGWRANLQKIEEPDPSRFCVVCGALDCTALRTAVQDAQAKRLRTVTVDESGAVVTADQHAVWAYRSVGLDWRRTAVVAQGRWLAPYARWFREPWPNPQIPADAAPRLPRAEQPIATPRHVQRWYSQKVGEGVAKPVELPEPDVRRILRERAGMSKAALGKLVGCSASAVHMWEIGKRTPTGEMAQRYLAELAKLAGQTGDELDPTTSGRSRYVEPPDVGCRCRDALRRCEKHNPVTSAERKAQERARWRSEHPEHVGKVVIFV